MTFRFKGLRLVLPGANTTVLQLNQMNPCGLNENDCCVTSGGNEWGRLNELTTTSSGDFPIHISYDGHNSSDFCVGCYYELYSLEVIRPSMLQFF